MDDMNRQRLTIPIDENGKEIFEYISDDFPCAVFYADIAKYLHGKSPWHWHEEVEIFVVTKGCLSMQIGSKRSIIQENEGAFINSNILHSMEVEQGSSCELITILFSPEIFLGGKQTKIFEKMTMNVYGNSELAAYLYDLNSKKNIEAMKIIKEIYAAFIQNQQFVELRISEYLARFWRLLLIDMREETFKESINKPLQESRIQKMITYIQENYSRQINVADIAASVHISPRECSRCFNNILHTTPITYLTDYRLSVSASFLVTTNMTISEIAFGVGFNSASYFSKIFTNSMNISPSKFRRRQV